MTDYARWNRTITDAARNIVNATVHVYRESDGLHATIYSDRAGATPKDNPFTLSNSDYGLAFFHAAGGAYKIVATRGSYSQTWRWEAVGTAAEYDVGSFVLSGQAPATVFTIAELKALPTATYKAATLVSAGRSGDWVFISDDYSALVTADTEGGVYVKADDTATTAGAWVRIYANAFDIRWFGAIGDGSTDDTAAIQAAVSLVDADGGSVYVPAGTFETTSELSWSGKPGRMFGDGIDVSVIECADHFMTVNNGSVTRPNFEFTGISVRATTAGTKHGLVYAGNASLTHEGESQLNVHGTQFCGIDDTTCWQVPVLITYGSNVRVSDNEIRGASLASYTLMQKAISHATGTVCEFRGNNIHFAEYGIWAANGTQHEDHKISGNTINYTDYGVYYIGQATSSVTLVEHNYINAAKEGVHITSSTGNADHSRVCDNAIWYFGDINSYDWTGVYIDGANCFVCDNEVQGFGGSATQLGIVLDGTTYAVVTGNGIYGCDTTVSEVNSPTHSFISGNVDGTYGSAHVIQSGEAWSNSAYGLNLLIKGSKNNAIGFLDSSGGNPLAVANVGGKFSFAAMPTIGNTASPPTVYATLGSDGFIPGTNDLIPLGTSSKSFSDLFLASGAVLNVAAGNWVATHTSGILTVGTGDLRVTTAGTDAASVATVGGTQTLTNKTLTTPTITTSLTINRSTTGNMLTLTNTDAGASGSPTMVFDRNSASPAANDGLGEIYFQGRDSNGNTTTYALFGVEAKTVTDGSEDGIFGIYTTRAGSFLRRMGVGAGLYTQGSQDNGQDTITALGYYVSANKVIGARDTGWTAMTGTANKATAYDTATVTLAQLAGRVMSLQSSLTTHGLIGA